MAVKLVVRHRNSATSEADELSYEFEQGRVVIGRSPGADVRLPAATVSETHATLEPHGSYYALCDERSLNGTFVNGVLLVPNRPRALADGDEIAVAEFTLTFHHSAIVRRATTPERTASLARRMLRDLLGAEHALSEPPYVVVAAGPDKDTRIHLEEPPSRMVIGRGHEAQLVLNDHDVSRAHLEIERDPDGSVARDLASKNGLEVNGKMLRERRLRHGDVLRIGATSLLYQDPAEQALRLLEKEPVVTLTRTRSERAPQLPEQAAVAQQQQEPEPEADSTRPASPIDYFVYALATLVLVASVAGLIWLLS
jgi:pSer/pThr/pTyr-binding forkhead associated (FHA) protein